MPARDEKNILKIKDLTVRFGGLTAVNKVCLDVERGEFLGIIGPNGAGKTTLFNLNTGVVKPSEGSIEFNGISLPDLAPDEIARSGISRTFQNIRLFPKMTALENVAIGIHRVPQYSLLQAVLRTPAVRRKDKETQTRAMEYLEMVGIESYAGKKAGSLPYGLQRRLEIARAIASSPELLLLDEPAAGMNNDECQDLIRFLQNLYEKTRITIILIEHHMDVVMKLCSRIFVLNLGAELSCGTPWQIQNDPAVIRAYLGERKKNDEQ